MSVKKRYRLFTILSVFVVSAGGILTWRASAVTVIPAGYDQFNTVGTGGTHEQWGDCVTGRPALPSNFFTNKEGFLSNAVTGCIQVNFTGRNAVPGFTGDTVLERTNPVTVPGSTPLVLTGLRFVAEATITATFPGGTPSITYTVLVDESEAAQSVGQISFDQFGHYTSSIGINRRYTFAPSDVSQPIRVADSTNTFDGNIPVFPPLDFTGDGTWSLPSGASTGPAIQAA